MTSDAIRQPGEPARPAPEPTAPSASETIPPETDAPATTPAEGSAAPAAGEVTGQAAADAGTTTAETATSEAATTEAATTEAATTEAATTEAATTEAATTEAVASGDAVTPAATVTTAEAVAATQAASADAPADSGPGRRERAAMFMRRFAVFALAVALLVGGIALGSMIFQRARPAVDVVPTGQVGTTAEQPALVTQEFIGALRANDFDAMRSAMQPEAALHFNDEIERRGVMTIDKVEVLGTHVAGPRSATEILMQYKNDQDLPLSINLVILVDGGKIEGFR